MDDIVDAFTTDWDLTNVFPTISAKRTNASISTKRWQELIDKPVKLPGTIETMGARIIAFSIQTIINKWFVYFCMQPQKRIQGRAWFPKAQLQISQRRQRNLPISLSLS
jgi:hypothetical protein